MNPNPLRANTRTRSLVARADGTPITAGTVNYYLIANTGTNAGKWYKATDNSWDANEAIAFATMEHKADGVWSALVDALAWPTAGVEYTEYAKESGDLHVPTSAMIRSEPATKIAVQGGPWATGATWSDGVVPAAGDNIIIRTGVTVTVGANLNLGTFGTLECQGSGQLQITSGIAVLTVSSGWMIEANLGEINNNRGRVASNASGGEIANNFGTVSKNNAGGVITVNNGGTVNTNYGTLDTNISGGVVDTNNGTIGNNNAATVMVNTGTITINGGVVVHDFGTIGTDNGKSAVPENVSRILDTGLEETTGGLIAAAFIKLYDVAAPVLVASDVMRGTDGVDTAPMRGTDGVDTSTMRGTDGVDTAAMRGTDGANTTKTGYSLASTGLDSVSIANPTGVATNFREMVVALWRRFYGKTTLSRADENIKTYASDGITVVTTQDAIDDGTTQTQGESS